MNSLLIWLVMVTVDLNVTDFIGNWLQYAFDPYTSLFANLTWGILFGFIGAGLYVGSKSTATAFTYLVVVGLIFGLILPEAVVGLFGLLLVFIGTSAMYVAFVTRRG